MNKPLHECRPFTERDIIMLLTARFGKRGTPKWVVEACEACMAEGKLRGARKMQEAAVKACDEHYNGSMKQNSTYDNAKACGMSLCSDAVRHLDATAVIQAEGEK